MVSDHESVHTSSKSDVALAYIGIVVPDSAEFLNVAFNRAGNMFQENLLMALANAGLPPSIVLSQRPLRSFPRSRTIWCSHSHARLAGNLPVNLVAFVNLPVLRPLTVGLANLINLIRWGWQQRNASYRVVCTYNLTEPPGLFTLIGARLIRAKAIASINDINVPGETVSASLSRRLDFWLQKKLMPRFDGLMVVNQRIIEDFAPQAPFIRLEGGVPESILQHTANLPAALDRAGASFTIVATGTFNEANGFMDILEAFSLLRGDGYRLRIAGTGPLEGVIKQAVEQDSRIEYYGYLSFEQVLALYSTADVLVNMRLTERINTNYFFPSKTLEYLASGVPVITTCTGHIAEAYSDFAFLLRDESPLGLAQMIERVASLDPEARTQKGKAAKDYIRTHNTWELQGRRIVEFICSGMEQ